MASTQHDATPSELDDKRAALRAILAEAGPCAVAFSAGVDSTLLLAVAHDVLGDNVLAITVDSPVHPARELAEARAFCDERGIRHIVFDVDEFAIEGFADNPPDRCYRCKRHLFGCIQQKAAEAGHPVVLEGSNTDDMGDYRPGFAAVQELGVKSPLLEAGLSKSDIRALSEQMGLATASKQSFACLATRFPYGSRITPDRLRAVDAAEQLLIDLGVHTVRVRVDAAGAHGAATARIEADPGDFDLIMHGDTREKLASELKAMGFANVALDLQGYRAGSMNELLDKQA